MHAMNPAVLKMKFSPQNKPFTDVVGMEIGAMCPQGVPAVRLRKRDGRTELMAAGFLNLPGQLPQNPETHSEPPAWTLPHPFQATYAALAITSPLVFLRHASSTDTDVEENKNLTYRTVSRVLAQDLPPLSAGIPEFQANWAARLLPEGHPPTACSLQVSSAAAINTFLASPTFDSLSGTAVVLFVFPFHTSFAAFHDSRLVLYREHLVGYGHIREAISEQMHIDPALSDSILEDTLIDPTPMIEPVLRSLFRQIEISYDYLNRRRNCQTENFLICGLPVGAKYWASLFSRMLNLSLKTFAPFEDLEKSSHAAINDLATTAPLLVTALGAARAVLEDM